MFGMNVMAWNGGDLEKLEVLQHRVGRLALGAPKWTAAEALRGDLGWSLFSERMVKAVLNYKAGGLLSLFICCRSFSPPLCSTFICFSWTDDSPPPLSSLASSSRGRGGTTERTSSTCLGTPSTSILFDEVTPVTTPLPHCVVQFALGGFTHTSSPARTAEALCRLPSTLVGRTDGYLHSYVYTER
ncbi:hypothetical protein FHG87_017655 [Trinorchestia longiramus]|nr:hypothetical protein FHG87_017655 [Trinorchestia longiramus]